MSRMFSRDFVRAGPRHAPKAAPEQEAHPKGRQRKPKASNDVDHQTSGDRSASITSLFGSATYTSMPAAIPRTDSQESPIRIGYMSPYWSQAADTGAPPPISVSDGIDDDHHDSFSRFAATSEDVSGESERIHGYGNSHLFMDYPDATTSLSNTNHSHNAEAANTSPKRSPGPFPPKSARGKISLSTASGHKQDPSGYEVVNNVRVSREGHLGNDRDYQIRTFTLGDGQEELFMLAKECAIFLGHHNTREMFRSNVHLARVVLHSAEERHLMAEGILPSPQQFQIERQRKTVVIPARSMLVNFGEQVVIDNTVSQISLSDTKTLTFIGNTDLTPRIASVSPKFVALPIRTRLTPAPNDHNVEVPTRLQTSEAIALYYSLCKESLGLVSSYVGQAFGNKSPTSPGGSAGSPRPSSQSSEQPSEQPSPTKRKSVSRDSTSSCPEDDASVSVAKKKPRKIEHTAAEEYPCWWYMKDPIRYHACRTWCSRGRDFHSYRRHHFEDHWRWGDLGHEGISFEIWNAAKHAACNQTTKSPAERAQIKWKRSYKILFALNDSDTVPEPTCPDIGHVHYRPATRSIRTTLPTPQCNAGRVETSLTTPMARPSSSEVQLQESGERQMSFLDLTTTYFPELNAEELSDFDTEEFEAAWDTRASTANELLQIHPEPDTMEGLVRTHISKIEQLLASMRREPNMVTYATVRDVLDLATHFETSYAYALLNPSFDTLEQALEDSTTSFLPVSAVQSHSTNTQAVPHTWSSCMRSAGTEIEHPTPITLQDQLHADVFYDGVELESQPNSEEDQPFSFDILDSHDSHVSNSINRSALQHLNIGSAVTHLRTEKIAKRNAGDGHENHHSPFVFNGQQTPNFWQIGRQQNASDGLLRANRRIR